MKEVARGAAILDAPAAITGPHGRTLPNTEFDTQWGSIFSCYLIVGLPGILFVAVTRWAWL